MSRIKVKGAVHDGGLPGGWVEARYSTSSSAGRLQAAGLQVHMYTVLLQWFQWKTVYVGLKAKNRCLAIYESPYSFQVQGVNTKT